MSKQQKHSPRKVPLKNQKSVVSKISRKKLTVPDSDASETNYENVTSTHTSAFGTGRASAHPPAHTSAHTTARTSVTPTNQPKSDYNNRKSSRRRRRLGSNKESSESSDSVKSSSTASSSEDNESHLVEDVKLEKKPLPPSKTSAKSSPKSPTKPLAELKTKTTTKTTIKSTPKGKSTTKGKMVPSSSKGKKKEFPWIPHMLAMTPREYLHEFVAPILFCGLQELVGERPDDAPTFLANFLMENKERWEEELREKYTKKDIETAKCSTSSQTNSQNASGSTNIKSAGKEIAKVDKTPTKFAETITEVNSESEDDDDQEDDPELKVKYYYDEHDDDDGDDDDDVIDDGEDNDDIEDDDDDDDDD